MASRKKYASVAEYLKDVPPAPRRRLQSIRRLVRKRVPAATEVISYNIPAFRLEKVFLYYAAFKDHLSIFPPLKASGDMARRLAPYRNEKGNLLFRHDEALPMTLLGQVVAALASQQGASRRKVERRRTVRGARRSIRLG